MSTSKITADFGPANAAMKVVGEEISKSAKKILEEMPKAAKTSASEIIKASAAASEVREPSKDASGKLEEVTKATRKSGKATKTEISTDEKVEIRGDVLCCATKEIDPSIVQESLSIISKTRKNYRKLEPIDLFEAKDRLSRCRYYET